MRSRRLCAVVGWVLALAATGATAGEPAATLGRPVAVLPPPVVPNWILPSFGKFGSGAPLPPVEPKRGPTDRTAIHFTGPAGMKVTWQLPDGAFGDDKKALTAPKEYNFVQGQVYRLRLKVAEPNGPERAFYPTIEVATATAGTRTFLAHASVPVTFSADDFAQAKAGNLVVKVIYLPDPAHQDFSTVVEAEEINSTRLEAGVDPVAEAKRRGSILAVIRVGNIDLEPRRGPRSNGR
jgi:hypothetical protein